MTAAQAFRGAEVVVPAVLMAAVVAMLAVASRGAEQAQARWEQRAAPMLPASGETLETAAQAAQAAVKPAMVKPAARQAARQAARRA